MNYLSPSEPCELLMHEGAAKLLSIISHRGLLLYRKDKLFAESI